MCPCYVTDFVLLGTLSTTKKVLSEVSLQYMGEYVNKLNKYVCELASVSNDSKYTNFISQRF